MLKYIEDQILRFFQKRCQHPGHMIAADILEGCAEGIEIKYCRRCGSIKTDWNPITSNQKYNTIPHWWRSPDPNLFRG